VTVVSAFFVLLTAIPGVHASSDDRGSTGSICLSPVQDDGLDRGYFSENFSVRIDRGAWHRVPVRSEPPRLIGDLETEGKHLVVVRDGDKPIESFWFDFSLSGSSQLCLWYKEWYRSWSLTPAKGHGKGCSCP